MSSTDKPTSDQTPGRGWKRSDGWATGLTPRHGRWGPTSIRRTIEQAARAANYFVSSVNLESVTRGHLADAVEHLLGQSVEGIIMIAAHDEALEGVNSQDPGVPFVVVEADLSKARCAVGVDQVAGARLATCHLIELGHTEILLVTGPMNRTEARARQDGWRSEVLAAGLRPVQSLSGDWTAGSGFAVGAQIVAREDVTAVFAANDQMALGILRALCEAGPRVPQDVSVVGVDDIPEAAYLIPPLTTIRQDFPAVGRRAIEVLQAAITQRTEALPRLIDPELVLRFSTAPPRRTRTPRTGRAAQ